MRDLFDRLLQEGESGIHRLIKEQMQESVTLDFKSKTDPTNGRFDKQDKSVFGKALSAFANSAGGLLIWGVDARKPSGGDIDCAQWPPKPICDIDRFKSDAQTLVGQLLMPRHEGILIAAVPSATSKSGYLLVLVDRSERRPHRSEAAGDKRYYKRAGDSSFEMEHYDLEDAFKRVSLPQIVLECRPSYHSAKSDGGVRTYTLRFDIFLKNVGTTTAKHLYIRSTIIRGASQGRRDAHGGGVPFNIPWIGFDENWHWFVAMSDDVLHPALSVMGAPILGDYIARDGAPPEHPDDEIAVEFTVAAGCEHAREISIDYKITYSEFRTLLKEAGVLD